MGVVLSGTAFLTMRKQPWTQPNAVPSTLLAAQRHDRYFQRSQSETSRDIYETTETYTGRPLQVAELLISVGERGTCLARVVGAITHTNKRVH